MQLDFSIGILGFLTGKIFFLTLGNLFKKNATCGVLIIKYMKQSLFDVIWLRMPKLKNRSIKANVFLCVQKSM